MRDARRPRNRRRGLHGDVTHDARRRVTRRTHGPRRRRPQRQPARRRLCPCRRGRLRGSRRRGRRRGCLSGRRHGAHGGDGCRRPGSRARRRGCGERCCRRSGRLGGGGGRLGPVLGGRGPGRRRCGLRGRSGDRSRGRHRRPGREQRERVDVALRLGGTTDAQVDVRRGHLRVAARADRPDDVSFGDRRALPDDEGAEMRERDGVPVGGVDREGEPGTGDRPGEADTAGGRRKHGSAGVTTDVDAAVLAAVVRMLRVEDERPENRAGRGPCPGATSRGDKQRGESREHECAAH